MARLGRCPDRELAQELGCSNSAVAYQRQRRGIPAYRAELGACHRLRWTRHRDAQLGRSPDGELAARWGISVLQVAKRRGALGIPRWRHFDEQALADRAGTMSDRELADQAGVSDALIQRIRRDRGIPAFRRIDWRRIDPELGTVSDADLAERWGVSVGSIRDRRRRRGIPASAHSTPFRWTAARLRQLGRHDDSTLAARWGIGRARIGRKRRALGIPPAPRERDRDGRFR